MNAQHGADAVPVITHCAVLDFAQAAAPLCHRNWNIVHRSDGTSRGLDKEFVSPPSY